LKSFFTVFYSAVSNWELGGVFGELGIMFHIRGQGFRASAWTPHILLEDFHFCLVLQVLLLSYIFKGSKNIYSTPNVSVTVIDPLETSYEISLFGKTLQSPHTSNWRLHGINFSTDSKYQSIAGSYLGMNYDGGAICLLVSANYDYFHSHI